MNKQNLSMENKDKRGGKREGAGRPSKSEEIKLIERLKPLEEKAFKALEKGLEQGDFKFTQLFYAYYAGKPRETKDITLTTEQPIFNIDNIDDLD